MQDNPDLANLSHQVILEQTPQGLRIQLVDQDGRPMFQQGIAEPMPYTKKLLAAVGAIIDTLAQPGLDQRPHQRQRQPAVGDAWELSAARANAARALLQAAALPSDRIYEVAGKAGSEPLAAGRPQRLGQPPALHPVDARSPAGAAGPHVCKKYLFWAIAQPRTPYSAYFACEVRIGLVIIGAVTDQRNTRVPQFFLTPGGPCPYLPGKIERKVFARLTGPLAQPLSEALTHSGFRRSQSIAYRPACEGCNACVSVRIVADEFASAAARNASPGATRDLARAAVRRRKRRANSSRCCAPIWIRAIPAAA